MKNLTQEIFEKESKACCAADGACEGNSLEAIVGRACFVVYLFFTMFAVFSVGMFLIRASGEWLVGMLAAILCAVVLRHVGYAHLRFEEHQGSLDCGFECHVEDSEFERWLRQVETLSSIGNLWERDSLRKRLFREYKSHPVYSKKLSARGYQPPAWLGM